MYHIRIDSEGKIEAARSFVNVPSTMWQDQELMQELNGYDIEDGGINCYSQSELEGISDILGRHNTPYEITDLIWDPLITERIQGKTYQTVAEAYSKMIAIEAPSEANIKQYFNVKCVLPPLVHASRVDFVLYRKEGSGDWTRMGSAKAVKHGNSAIKEFVFDSKGTYKIEVSLAPFEKISVELTADTDIDDIKKELDAMFDKMCETKIVGTFFSPMTGRVYGFGPNDQLNMTQQSVIFMQNPTLTGCIWKTSDAGPIWHTKEQFAAMLIDAEAHKRLLITTYWKIQQMIKAATTREQLYAIDWDTVQNS